MLKTLPLKQIIQLSRPHFWLYEGGTFLLGAIIAATDVADLLSLESLLWGIYFLFPANLLIYGINDIFDYETDIKNPKKNSYESVLPREAHRFVFGVIFFTTLPWLIGAIALTTAEFVSLALFWFFAIFYSASPIRAKASVFLDSFFSAGHYIATGVFGYFLISPDSQVPWLGIVGGMAWAMAMHAYSAIPDIQADTEAGLSTTATFLGKNTTTAYCLFLYSLSALVLYSFIGGIAVLLFTPYLYLLTKSFGKDTKDLLKLYGYFPYVNAMVGMLLCFAAFYTNGWLQFG